MAEPLPGTVSTSTLPPMLSVAVKGVLLFATAGQEYAIPLSYTEAVVSLRKSDLHKVSHGLMATYLEHTISVVFLDDVFALGSLKSIGAHDLHHSYERLEADQKLDVVVVSYGGRLVGLVVDKLMQQMEIVEKTLHAPLDQTQLFSGATILGSGSVCLVLDVASILSALFRERIRQAALA